jgi:hypothetical protein
VPLGSIPLDVRTRGCLRVPPEGVILLRGLSGGRTGQRRGSAPTLVLGVFVQTADRPPARRQGVGEGVCWSLELWGLLGEMWVS